MIDVPSITSLTIASSFFAGFDFQSDPFPAFLFDAVGRFVLPIGQIREFAFHFMVAFHSAVRNFSFRYRLPDAAARFVQVAAIWKTAMPGKAFNFRKGVFDTATTIPKRNLPDTRIVDHHSPLGYHYQISAGGGMLPFAHMFAYRARRLYGLPAKTIHQGGFAGTG
jgi:hypothetical protein